MYKQLQQRLSQHVRAFLRRQYALELPNIVIEQPPRVELGEPRHVIGKTTRESVQSGVVFGTTVLVDGLCERFEEELGDSTVVSTGGLGGLFSRLTERIEHHEPWLTLHGLRLIFEKNVD